jgi:hypothetical protein
MLPSNFVSKITTLTGYSKAPIRILPQSQGDVKSNQLVKFTLPVGSVLDLKTFMPFFDYKSINNGTGGITGAKIVGLPKHGISALIDTFEVWINGRNICNIPQYNRVYSIVQDFKNNHNSLVKKMGTNADPSVYTTLGNDGVLFKSPTKYTTAVAANNDFHGTYCINSWIGFLECSPSIIDTNLLGNVEIILKMAPPTVLWAHGLVAADSVDYQLSNIVAYCDQIYFKDETYYSVIKGLMQASDGFKIVYPNYMVYTGNDITTNKTNTIKITENCSSLDMILYTFFNNTSTGKQALLLGDEAAATTADEHLAGRLPASAYTFDNVLKNNNESLVNSSIYFRRNGVGVSTIQFEVNSQDLTVPMNPLQAWNETLKAFELHLDSDVKQINPAIKDLSIFQKDFYVAALSTSHIGNRDADLGTLISGRDTMSTSLNIAVKCTSTGTDNAHGGCQAAVITKFTSRVHVSGERNIFPVR